MLRLAGFFVLAILLATLLGHLPVVGPLFARTGCIGIWISAMLLSWAFTRYGQRVYRMRKDAAEIRRLAAVASPHTEGKLGTLLLNQGRARKSLEPLARAAAGEPEVAEWHFRLGSARLWTKDMGGAVESLRTCVQIDPEHAYGEAGKRLAEALTRHGRAEEALEVLATVERNHGPSPESAYRRGVALKSLGRKTEARSAFEEVGGLASEAARYQRKSAVGWVLKARLASVI